jgi:hypothetical protein
LSFRFLFALPICCTLFFSAQPVKAVPALQPAGAPAAQPAVLPPALEQIRLAVAGLNGALGDLAVQRWKLSGDARRAIQADLDSIERDISGTLPTLISAAEANPDKISTAVSVYRNVDALYDVLLRVTLSAQMAGARDSAVLEQQRALLEAGRSRLGAALLSASQAQETELLRLRAAAAPPKAASAPAHVVVNDGPTAARPRSRRRRTPAARPATEAQPAPATTQP